MTPAVAYYRMSLDRQEHSIGEQRAAVEAYAAKHAYEIVREYADEGISGDDTEKRVAFQKMLRDAKELGDFQVILCWDQDRFGRFDPLEAGYWIKPLRDARVRLETLAQGKIDWEDFGGRIIYAVQQEGKHAYLRDLSRNVIRGMAKTAREGKWGGGRPPVGYRVEDQRLVPGDPAEVEMVRRLFREYAGGGVSLRVLTHRLNAEGSRTRTGGKWYPNRVRLLLTCPLYVGDMVWNRTHEGRYHGLEGGEIRAKKRRTAIDPNPKGDWVIVPDTHEPLIDRDTFEAVQRRLSENRAYTTPHQGGGDFFLSGLVFCGHCGRRMFVCKMMKHGRPHYYLRCSGYQMHGASLCQNYTTEERAVARVVLRKIRDDFLDPANLAALRAEMERQLHDAEADPGQAKGLRGRLADLDRKIQEGTERYLTAPKHLTAVLEAKLSEWQKERESIAAALRKAEAARRADTDHGAKVEKALRRLHKLPANLDRADPAKVRDVLREAVARIECRFERVPFGKKQRSRLVKGTIHMRPDLLLSKVVPVGGPTRMPIGETRW